MLTLCVDETTLAAVRAEIAVTPGEEVQLRKLVQPEKVALLVDFRNAVLRAFDEMAANELPTLQAEAAKRRERNQRIFAANLPRRQRQQRRWEEKRREAQASV